MKSGFRQSMAWLHTWTGLLVSWVLYFIFVTGTLGYFDNEIDLWMAPEIHATDTPPLESMQAAVSFLEQQEIRAKRWFIDLTGSRNAPYLSAGYEAFPEEGRRFGPFKRFALDAQSGQELQHRDTAGGQTLYRMHWRLHYMPRMVAYYIVGLCTLFMLLALVTGIVVHKKIFKEFFTFRRNKGPTSWLDIHNLFSVMSIPFHLMITYSGLILFLFTYMPLILAGTYGFEEQRQREFFDSFYQRGDIIQPAGKAADMLPVVTLYRTAERYLGKDNIWRVDIQYPGDANAQVQFRTVPSSPAGEGRQLTLSAVSGDVIKYQAAYQGARQVQSVIVELHEGLFAGPLLRWLYFLSGLLGTAMIASGMILWTVKRRNKEMKKAHGPSLGYRITEGLNLGTIAGLPIAIGVFFWANRLLPVEMAARAQWEIHCLFISWGLLMLYGVWRGIDKGWREQLVIGAIVFLTLPIGSALTTSRDFFTSLQRGDWVFIGFETIAVLVGAVYAAAASYLYRRAAKTQQQAVLTTQRGAV